MPSGQPHSEEQKKIVISGTLGVDNVQLPVPKYNWDLRCSTHYLNTTLKRQPCWLPLSISKVKMQLNYNQHHNFFNTKNEILLTKENMRSPNTKEV